MSFIVILLKIILLAFIFIIGAIGKRVYQDFKKLKAAPDWEETTIFGRILISTMFSVSILGMAVLCIFLLFVVISNVTITSYF